MSILDQLQSQHYELSKENKTFNIKEQEEKIQKIWDKVSLLAICYYNLGTQFEFLKKY